MIKHPNQDEIQFTWQAIIWRLLLTALLLLMLAGSGLTLFNPTTPHPNNHTLTILPQTIDTGWPAPIAGPQ